MFPFHGRVQGLADVPCRVFVPLVRSSVGAGGQPLHAVACEEQSRFIVPRQFVVPLARPTQRAFPQRRALWPECVACWRPIGDRKAFGSGANAHANWRGIVDIQRFSESLLAYTEYVGRYIPGIVVREKQERAVVIRQP